MPGKKKHFASSGGKKEKDFIPSQGLMPEMKSQGFIVDKGLFKVGRMLQEKKIDCKILDHVDSEAICAQAIKDNRIFITTNLKLFNKKVQLPRCCLAYKSSPFSKFLLSRYFAL
jgi:uncharacterized protein with PIN domain